MIILKIIYHLLLFLVIKKDVFLSNFRKFKYTVLKRESNKNKNDIFIFCVYDRLDERYDLIHFFKNIKKKYLLIIVSNSEYIRQYYEHADILISVSKNGRDWLCYKAGYDFVKKNSAFKFNRITFLNDSVWYFKKKQNIILKKLNCESNVAMEKNFDLNPHISGYFFSIYITENDTNSLDQVFSSNLNYVTRFNNIYIGEHQIMKLSSKPFSVIEEKPIDTIPKSYQQIIEERILKLIVLKGDVILRSNILDYQLNNMIKNNSFNQIEQSHCEKWISNKTSRLNKGLLNKLDFWFYRNMLTILDSRTSKYKKSDLKD